TRCPRRSCCCCSCLSSSSLSFRYFSANLRNPGIPQLMKILVISSGGREHAIAWRLAQSPKVARVYVAPGNAGTAREDGVFNVDITGIGGLGKFAQDEGH